MTLDLPGVKGSGTAIIGDLFPFVIGVCSNLPNENPPYRFFMVTEVNNYLYVGEFVEYIEHLAKKAAALCNDRFAHLRAVIQVNLQKAKFARNKYGIRLHEENLKKLDEFVNSFPVLGYNSQVRICCVCM